MENLFSNDFYVPVPSIAVKHALYKLAESADLKVSESSWDSDDIANDILEYPNILWNFRSKHFCGNSTSLVELDTRGSKVITIDELVKVIEHAKCNFKSLQLTKDYNAEIDIDARTVKVGCQTITFDKLKELYGIVGDKL